MYHVHVYVCVYHVSMCVCVCSMYMHICHNIGTWWPFWDTHSIPLGVHKMFFLRH